MLSLGCWSGGGWAGGRAAERGGGGGDEGRTLLDIVSVLAGCEICDLSEQRCTQRSLLAVRGPVRRGSMHGGSNALGPRVTSIFLFFVCLARRIFIDCHSSMARELRVEDFLIERMRFSIECSRFWCGLRRDGRRGWSSLCVTRGIWSWVRRGVDVSIEMLGGWLVGGSLGTSMGVDMHQSVHAPAA